MNNNDKRSQQGHQIASDMDEIGKQSTDAKSILNNAILELQKLGITPQEALSFPSSQLFTLTPEQEEAIKNYIKMSEEFQIVNNRLIDINTKYENMDDSEQMSPQGQQIGREIMAITERLGRMEQKLNDAIDKLKQLNISQQDAYSLNRMK